LLLHEHPSELRKIKEENSDEEETTSNDESSKE
jgi:hypothetical protein